MQLRELEVYGVVFKKVYAQLPMKVEYFLTDAGRSTLPIIAMMDQWGTANRAMCSDKDKSVALSVHRA